MRRKALLKDGDYFDVLEEGEFQAEKALQEALKRNPEVLLVADLELDEVVVVGRETSLPAGFIDLLLVDAAGRQPLRRDQSGAESGLVPHRLHGNA